MHGPGLPLVQLSWKLMVLIVFLLVEFSTSYGGHWDQWAEDKAVLKALVSWIEGQIFGKVNCLWALNVPTHSCQEGQEYQAQTVLHSGHFSGLCLHQTTLRNKVKSSPNSSGSLITIKAVDSPSPVFPKCAINPLTAQYPFKSIFVTWDLRGMGILMPTSWSCCLLCCE